MKDMNPFFVEAFDLRKHPIKKAKKKIQLEYITTLTYIIKKTINEADCQQVETKQYILERLKLYHTQLIANKEISYPNEELSLSRISTFTKLCKSKYHLILVGDIAMILLEKSLILHAMTIIKKALSFKQQYEIEQVASLLYNKREVENKYLLVSSLINQYRLNYDFISQKERRIIVTANMSAGKSTLINALIGKSIARTSQEVCTGNACYLYNKAYEDGNIHLSTQNLNLRATADDLHGYDWNGHISIASYFTGIIPHIPRLCIIDTPGVDAALYNEHSKRAHEALLNDCYDIIIYVVSPTKLGTEAEKNHLQWVAQNLPKDKIIFVLNKLDNYHDFSDSIEESVYSFKEDLLKTGFDNPVICPISAYFSYLLKLKITGQPLSEDEADEYTFYSNKFKKSSYDLSHYYEGVQCLPADSEEIALSKRVGLYGLEKIIYGSKIMKDEYTLYSTKYDKYSYDLPYFHEGVQCLPADSEEIAISKPVGLHIIPKNNMRRKVMKKVFIKYNPYNLETELTVDGKKLAQNSKIGERILPGSRLQEWVEDLPKLLIEEYNDTDFDIVFHGTLLDYEDLTEVFTQAFERGELTVKLDRIPAKETFDKEVLIDEVFKEIQEGPFDELRDVEIISAFQHAKSSDFEVCVVATMSAGKSTLINSMLGTKLMPSKQEACTAIITRIKDTEENDTWQAEVYSKDNQLIETHKNLTYNTMVRLNNDENVSVIKTAGNIPFVSSEDVSLVLIDTPGPNNARDPEHKRVQSEFLNKSSKSLVLYIMEGTFGSDDDNALLQRVADSMKVGGKQSKDRFIFVVNKMDDRRKEDGDTTQTLDRIRAYLKRHGIINPNLFPAAALPALNIRLIQNGAEVDEDTMDETEMKVRKLNRNETMHFENYASLPKSIRDDIKRKLNDAKNSNDANTEALIHTGVVSIEAAIRQYVQKYAKTAKIKNIVDTFMHKLDEVGCFEKTKQELAKNRDDGERIARQIKAISQKVDDVKSAQRFKDAVDDAVVRVSDDAKEIIDGIVQKYQAELRKKINDLRGKELKKSEVMDEISSLVSYAKKLEPDFQAELSDLISDSLVKTINALLHEYKSKLSSLTSEIDTNELAGITIEPLKLMGGSVPTVDEFSFEKLVQSKKVEKGQEFIKNNNKKWYKPWTWFQEKGHWEKIYENVEYVPAGDLAQEFFVPIEDNIGNNGELAHKHAIRQSNRIAGYFNIEFKHLDEVLKQKLAELESYATDKDQAEARIKETEDRLSWLEVIKEDVASILEI